MLFEDGELSLSSILDLTFLRFFCFDWIFQYLIIWIYSVLNSLLYRDTRLIEIRKYLNVWKYRIYERFVQFDILKTNTDNVELWLGIVPFLKAPLKIIVSSKYFHFHSRNKNYFCLEISKLDISFLKLNFLPSFLFHFLFFNLFLVYQAGTAIL